ncbi:hypothetical protein ACIP88_04975 [Streptomyces uncialis]|uniref:hypothetical protein n=1 Tax=Streptomyces uncialis TaxID=1048205 RepID=UPI00381DD74F
MALFSPDDLRLLLGRPLTDPQCIMAHDLTVDALRGEVGDRITDPPQPGVRSLALAVAARVLTNPAGIRSEQAGGMSISYADSQTGVMLSDDERRRLRRAVGLATGAGMLNIAPDVDVPVGTPWRST